MRKLAIASLCPFPLSLRGEAKAIYSPLSSLRGMSEAKDEAIYNDAHQRFYNGIAKDNGEIPNYRFPRKFFKFSRNDRWGDSSSRNDKKAIHNNKVA